KREAFEKLKGSVRTVDGLDGVLQVVENHNLIRPAAMPDRPGPGRKPSQVYETHPAVLESDSQYSQYSHNAPAGPPADPPEPNSANTANTASDGAASTEAVSPVRSDAAATHLLVNDPEGLQAVAAALDNTALVGLDVETTGLDPRTDRVRLLSL